MVAAAVGFVLVRIVTDWVFPLSLVAVVAWTTGWWLLVTWLTPPEPDPTLDTFYARVTPPGPGWGPVASRLGHRPSPLQPLVVAWLSGTVLVYAILFGVGHLLLHSLTAALPYFAVAALCSWLVARALPRREDPSALSPSVALLRRRTEERSARPAGGRRRIRRREGRRARPARSAGRLRRLAESATPERVRRSGLAERVRRPGWPNGFGAPGWPKGLPPPGCVGSPAAERTGGAGGGRSGRRGVQRLQEIGRQSLAGLHILISDGPLIVAGAAVVDLDARGLALRDHADDPGTRHRRPCAGGGGAAHSAGGCAGGRRRRLRRRPAPGRTMVPGVAALGPPGCTPGAAV